MLVCDHKFHAVLLQQSSDRERKILPNIFISLLDDCHIKMA